MRMLLELIAHCLGSDDGENQQRSHNSALPTTPAFAVIDSTRDRCGVVMQALELPPVEEDVRLVHGCLANVAGLLPVLAVGMRHLRYFVHPFHPKT